MPSSPRGVRYRSGQVKRTRLYRQPRADVGIGSYKNGRSLAVGGVRIKGTSEKPVRDFPTV